MPARPKLRTAQTKPKPQAKAKALTTNIIDFISDPDLLGRSFEGESWDRWRAVLRAAFCLPMSEKDLLLFGEVSGGRASPTRPVRELVACVGRGGGKDSIASAIAAYVGATGDFSRLRPGEKAAIITMATDRSQAGIAFGYTRDGLLDSPLLQSLVMPGGTVGRIGLKTGAEIEVVTGNSRAARGKTIACAIYDEVGHWRGADFSEPDVEIDSACSGGLSRFPGSLKVLISSVHRADGLLYEKYSRHFAKDGNDVLVVLGTTLEFNPGADRAYIESQFAIDEQKAGAEYFSIWRDDLSSFLDRELVEQAIDKGIASRPPDHSKSYVMFADPSGGRSDSFTACVGHREGADHVIDVIYELKAPFKSDIAVTDVANLAKYYGVNIVYGDNFGADLVVTLFRQQGITYQKGELNKSEIYLNAVSLFTSGRVRLLDNPRLAHQLVSLERRPARGSGHDSVDHPPQGKDDVANSVCGCLVTLGSVSAPIILSRESLNLLRALGSGRDRFGRSTRRFG